MKTAREQFYELGGDEEEDPIERLRFFCSCAMEGQDWLDVEEFFDDITTRNDDELAIVVGDYFIRTIDASTVWFAHAADGEGMILPRSKLENMLKKFWKEEF